MEKVDILGVRIEQSNNGEGESIYQEAFVNSQYAIMELRDAQALIFSPKR